MILLPGLSVWPQPRLCEPHLQHFASKRRLTLPPCAAIELRLPQTRDVTIRFGTHDFIHRMRASAWSMLCQCCLHLMYPACTLLESAYFLMCLG